MVLANPTTGCCCCCLHMGLHLFAVVPQPVYMNMSDLHALSSTGQEDGLELKTPTAEDQSSLGSSSSGYGSPQIIENLDGKEKDSVIGIFGVGPRKSRTGPTLILKLSTLENRRNNTYEHFTPAKVLFKNSFHKCFFFSFVCGNVIVLY